MTYGERMKKLIERKGYTMKEVAQGIGISPTALYNSLREDHFPTVATLIKLAQFLNVSTDWILGITEIETAAFVPDEKLWLVSLYERASDADRKIVDTILGKYRG